MYTLQHKISTIDINKTYMKLFLKKKFDFRDTANKQTNKCTNNYDYKIESRSK